ncbi:unnamed protein product, partial [marine sediment metagenome]
ERNGVKVEIDSSFDKGQATYPIPTHQVYSAGQPITATFWGASTLGGEVVDFMLFKQISLTEIREIAVDTYNGNLEPIRDKLSSPDWIEQKTLDLVSGDASVTIPKQTEGAYLLVVVKEEDSDIYVYSATIVEVVAKTLDVICPEDVKKGDPLNIDTGEGGISVAVLIKKEAYTANIKLESDGSVVST